MKKFLKSLVLLVVALFLITPFSAHADMSAPSFKPYQMQVINPNGVEYYETSPSADPGAKPVGRIPKDTIVTIYYEGTDYYSVSYKLDAEKEVSKIIHNLNGLVLIKDSFSLEDAKKDQDLTEAKTTRKALVYKEEGVSLRKGPASAYPEIARFEKGTKLEYKYSLTSYGGGSGTTYIYVETDKGNGWLKVLDKEVLIENDYTYIFRVDKVTPNGTIPANTILTPEYKADEWTHEALFSYNGFEIMVKTYFDDDGTVVEIEDGPAAKKCLAKNDLIIHKTADQNSEVLGKIPAKAEFTNIGTYYYDEHTSDETDNYIEYKGIKGWFHSQGKDYEWADDDEDESEEDDEDEDEPEDEDEDEDEDDRRVPIAPKPQKEDKGFSGETIVLMCTMAGITVALAALMIIILANKKTKNNIQSKNVNVNQPMNQPVNPNMNQPINQQMNQSINPVQTTDPNQTNNPGQNG